MYYRRPDVYDGRNVVVVGGGPSGWDLVRLLSRHAKTLYWSRDPERRNRANAEFLPAPRGTLNVPRISSLSGGVVHLQDGRQLQDVDAIILATGYEIRMPFLTAGGCLDELEHTQPQPPDVLTTNSYYIHPLYEHTLSLDTRYPLGSLYFNGIIIYNPTGMTDYGQALFTAYTIANPALLESRDELFAALKAREARVNKGYGALFGHLAGGSHEDLLVNYLRDRGLAGQPGIPPLGVNFTDPWRVFALEHGLEIHTAWYAGLEEQGEEWEKRLTHGRRTEEDYVRLMHEVVEWWAHKKQHL
ncbi:hypothetical protein EXIGLDRAFT_843705 [Exidia glandulosa HHB12029]|uniref:FAD/NAD(P)-binding domain-containing protein n=1 Tax=Exidia glandulosa HHB12029 TaxID=1314781 RepID=A0A165CH27_EXIGL|nr:hypothetical protein EXIGLDRAFT_843705 [Exidia glandulosa HHB12029]